MKSVFALDGHVNFHLSNIFERKGHVEEADEGAYGAACVVVFRFAKQQCGSAFDIPKINVVAERGPFDLAGTRNYKDNFRLRVVPRRHRMKAGVMAVADSGHGLRLGEQLCVWTDPDLEVLRPKPFFFLELLL